MFSAERFPSVGSGSTLPPATSGASASSSTTISAPFSVRVCHRHESLWPLSFIDRSNLIARRFSSSV